MTIAVGLGFMDFPFSSADAYWRWVAMCEDGGVDSVWQTDRLVSEKPFLECMSAMAALAGATKRLKFGMNVVSVGLRDPLLLAKQCATIDMLSNGRLLPGFGIGNIRAADWLATGADTAGRGRRSNEALEIIARLWVEDSVDFDGEFYRYKNAVISPKPVQKRLPMWLGGASEAAIRRTARFGTGWQAGLETADEVGAVISAIKLALEKEGRTIDHDHYGAAFSYRFGAWDDAPVQAVAAFFRDRLAREPEPRIVAGGTEHIMARLQDYIAAGASKFILSPIGEGDAEIFSQTERLIAEVLPEVKKLNG
ncbi:MAG: LLM class flavin-dependent oxidoreductase [Proteobacteria bacterium]|nr:LLM class flavin-dependent oxidoreductase [Pseudomonadota bacterium]MDA1354885.1 LLM class flavin-dependent oxidoreductase [Pseudomonadota bacterium]